MYNAVEKVSNGSFNLSLAGTHRGQVLKFILAILSVFRETLINQTRHFSRLILIKR
jgi:hypothetical protein